MLVVLLLIAAFFLIAYLIRKWTWIDDNFFKRKNIKYNKPKFIFGNLNITEFIFKGYSAIEFAEKTYNEFPDESIYGTFDFSNPQFVVRDPELIKQFCIKDFDHFEDNNALIDGSTDKLWGNTLFMLRGEKWRKMRAELSPSFTGSKMRQMFGLVLECVTDVVEHFSAKAETGESINIEVKDIFSRFTSDVIASSAFGIKINSVANPVNDFYVASLQLANGVGSTSFSQRIRLLLIFKLPKLAQLLKIQLTDSSTSELIRSLILDAMEHRAANNIQRHDMINSMMQLRDNDSKWNDDELISQCFIFFIAGLDTVSTLLTMVSHELVVNPDIQQRLYEEIAKTNAENNRESITYDVLHKMKYLDQVISETLRKWPPTMQMMRVCVKDYAYDDGDRYKFDIEKGTPLTFTIYGIHHDEKYYSNPEKFDPERFSDENKNNIISGAYIPFGIGPRICIGSRFALMEVKAILYHLLLKFSFEANEKTEIPIKFKKSPILLAAENGVHLELKLRKKVSIQ